jgi:signal peptidase I
VLAVILAFIFRSYEAEAFVIPTGSMASTLMGRHVDVYCDECGYRYSSGASAENSDSQNSGLVIQTTCPICRYPKILARDENPEFNGKANPNEDSFNGDRLIVDKVTYLISDPKRWDVIVFRYPYNQKQNYIKRLVGLPEETFRIHNGDVLAKKDGESEFKICRKPPNKLREFLQIVDDTNHIPTKLLESNGPSRWQQWSVADESKRDWKVSRGEKRELYSIEEGADDVAWLRYRHILPQLDESPDSRLFRWNLPDGTSSLRGQLITDFYPYNENVLQTKDGRYVNFEPGYHWAGDLAVECEVEIQSDGGELWLDLVEGGIHFRCMIDVSSGEATLSIDNASISDEPMSFVDDSGEKADTVVAQTEVRGKGKYHLRFANADDELTLWVNEQVVQFNHPARFNSPAERSPKWSIDDPGDAEPVGIGSRNCSLSVDRIRVLRDLYYHAIKSPGTPLPGILSTDYTEKYKRQVDDYKRYDDQYKQLIRRLNGRRSLTMDEMAEIRSVEQELSIATQAAYELLGEVNAILLEPESWNSTDLFTTRKPVEFVLDEGQYFPMGDNSPSSKDARVWGPDHYVDAKWLIGKAQFVFWPHSWRRPVPYWPNFNRFRFVR